MGIKGGEVSLGDGCAKTVIIITACCQIICQAKCHVCQTVMRYGLTNCQFKKGGSLKVYVW